MGNSGNSSIAKESRARTCWSSNSLGNLAVARLSLIIIFLFLLATLFTIAWLECMRPSPDRWWREAAETILTKFSTSTQKPIELSAVKFAFRLRRGFSSPATISQLANAARRHGDHSLSAVAKVYLARRSSADEALLLAQEAFDLSANELTAWQYATYLRAAGKPVPREVNSVLLNGRAWEYMYLLRINAQPENISESVRENSSKIVDAELMELAQSTYETEVEYMLLSWPGIRSWVLARWKEARMEVADVARKNRFFACLDRGVAVLIKRTAESVYKAFTAPGPLASRSAWQLMRALDALEAFSSAVTCNDQILKAREALPDMDGVIYTLESGQVVSDLEREVTRKRSALTARLNNILSDPERYEISDSHVLSAIEGEDPSGDFLSAATRE